MYEKNEQKIKISKVLWGRLHRASKILEVSMQSLTSFLICMVMTILCFPHPMQTVRSKKPLKNTQRMQEKTKILQI